MTKTTSNEAARLSKNFATFLIAGTPGSRADICSGGESNNLCKLKPTFCILYGWNGYIYIIKTMLTFTSSHQSIISKPSFLKHEDGVCSNLIKFLWH